MQLRETLILALNTYISKRNDYCSCNIDIDFDIDFDIDNNKGREEV